MIEHKTPFYLQNVMREYIMANVTMACKVVAGLAFEELELPLIAVFAQGSEETTSGHGKTGNRLTTVNIVLQTGASTSEEEHWDRWAEVEDMLDYRTAAMVERMEEYSQELFFLNFIETIGMQNQVIENTRITQKQVQILTGLKQ